VNAIFTEAQIQQQQRFQWGFPLAATRQASAGQPVYDRHDSAVIHLIDSAVIGDVKAVAVEGGDTQQSE
jgi:hypothetical protein